MLSLAFNQILLYFSIAVTMFLPGWFLLLAVFGKNKTVSALERFILSFGLGIIITDFIAFAYSKLNISITGISAIIGTAVFCLACLIVYKYRTYSDYQDENRKLFSFSKNQFVLILLLLFLTLFIKTAYLSATVAPTATDMGHHMYWTKLITENHKLPDYGGMPDFIIGEHIALAEIAMIAGFDFFSAFPVVVLLLINILGILTVFSLTLRIFKNKNIAIFTLLFLGMLFAISSPQAKFISGGVIGNIMGNYLLSLIFYFFARAFSELDGLKSASIKIQRSFLSFAVFATFGLFYTHHLTAFIFLFIFAFLAFFFLTINIKNIINILKTSAKIIFSPPVIATLILGLIFFFFIFTPTYIKTSAVETAVGVPEKSTRTGLSFNNLKTAVGDARITLGFIGLLILTLSLKKKSFGFSLIFSWAVMIFIMSAMPYFLFINLPSSRIGNYLSYPMAILAAYGLHYVFNSGINNPIPKKLLSSAFIIITAFVFANGLSDNAEAFKKSPDFSPMVQTFNASEYLAEKTNAGEIILKDHNYITSSDSWIKLFFMRGYKYPLSRGYFRRYEDKTNAREMCTLYMISNPDGEQAKVCYEETKTDYIMINPVYDSVQFKKLKNFDQVYMTEEIAIYHKK